MEEYPRYSELQYIDTSIPSCIHTFIPSCIHTFIPSCIHTFIPSCIQEILGKTRNHFPKRKCSPNLVQTWRGGQRLSLICLIMRLRSCFSVYPPHLQAHRVLFVTIKKDAPRLTRPYRFSILSSCGLRSKSTLQKLYSARISIILF